MRNIQPISILLEKGTSSTQKQRENSFWILKNPKTEEEQHNFIGTLKTSENPDNQINLYL